MTASLLIIAGLLINGCGGADNVCAIASQHVVSCIPGKKAVNPTCDASAAERANMVLGMSCDQIQALARSGKADWGWCWSFWDCGDSNDEPTNEPTNEPTDFRKVRLGEHCTDHPECLSGWCDPVKQTCGYRNHIRDLPNGEPCFNKHECVSNYCHPETKICTGPTWN